MKALSEKHTFSKAERLCSRKLIDELVAKGKSLSMHPLRMSWLQAKLDEDFPAQVLMAVPKRNFKKAVDRNKIKRRMREAYRKNKLLFYTSLFESQKQIALMLVYTDKKIISYPETEKAMVLTLTRLKKEVEKKSPQ